MTKYLTVERELLERICSNVDCKHFISQEQEELRTLLAAPQDEGGEAVAVGWQWLNTAHFRKNIPKEAIRSHWEPLMTVSQHRRILAGVNREVRSGVPEGWRFSTADFSLMASGKKSKGSVSLVRDPESRKAWHSMTDELKDADDGPELYVSGYGYTLAEAFADAANKANAAAPLPPSPAAKAAASE